MLILLIQSLLTSDLNNVKMKKSSSISSLVSCFRFRRGSYNLNHDLSSEVKKSPKIKMKGKVKDKKCQSVKDLSVASKVEGRECQGVSGIDSNQEINNKSSISNVQNKESISVSEFHDVSKVKDKQGQNVYEHSCLKKVDLKTSKEKKIQNVYEPKVNQEINPIASTSKGNACQCAQEIKINKEINFNASTSKDNNFQFNNNPKIDQNISSITSISKNHKSQNVKDLNINKEMNPIASTSKYNEYQDNYELKTNEVIETSDSSSQEKKSKFIVTKVDIETSNQIDQEYNNQIKKSPRQQLLTDANLSTSMPCSCCDIRRQEIDPSKATEKKGSILADLKYRQLQRKKARDEFFKSFWEPRYPDDKSWFEQGKPTFQTYHGSVCVLKEIEEAGRKANN